MSPSRRAASRMPGCNGVALHWGIGALAHWLLWALVLWRFGTIRALGHRGIGTCKGHLLAA